MKKLIKSKQTHNIEIIISFAVIAFLEISVLYATNKLSFTSDMGLQFQRIVGVARAIKNGVLFPRFDFWTLGNVGNAVLNCYPYLILWPFIILLGWIPVTVRIIYLYEALAIFIMALISFYSCRNIIKNIKRRYLFAIMYITTDLVIINLDKNFDIGAILIETFLPLVFFGVINLIKFGKWRELACGLILSAYSHILGTLIVGSFAAIMILLNTTKFRNRNKIKSLCKAVIVTILATLYQTASVAYVILNNNVQKPVYRGNGSSEPISVIITIIGIIPIIGIINELVNYKHIHRISKQLLWIGAILLLLTTGIFSIFPLSIIQNGITDVLQYTSRILILPIIIFEYELATNIGKYAKHNNVAMTIKVAIVVIIATLSQATFQSIIAEQGMGSKAISISRQHKIIVNYTDESYEIHLNKLRPLSYIAINNKYGLNSLLNIKNMFISTPDYLSTGSNYKFGTPDRKAIYAEMSNHKIINKHENERFKPNKNGTLTFINKRNHSSTETPIDKYNGINYQVSLNGRHAKYSGNKDNLMVINNVPKGKNVLKVRDKPSMFVYLYAIISIGGIMLLMIRRKKQI